MVTIAMAVSAVVSVTMVSVVMQGTLIEHLKEHILLGDMTSKDTILYYATVSVGIM